jgi:hypothetical protein
MELVQQARVHVLGAVWEIVKVKKSQQLIVHNLVEALAEA